MACAGAPIPANRAKTGKKNRQLAPVLKWSANVTALYLLGQSRKYVCSRVVSCCPELNSMTEAAGGLSTSTYPLADIVPV
jgi:hypothetical protein